jgi:hypothetical protein
MKRVFITMSILTVLGLASFVTLPLRDGRHALADDRPATPPSPPDQAKDKSVGIGEKAQTKRTGYGYEYGGAGYDRSKEPDSFKYYGPNGLWYTWDQGQRLGRDTWFFDTGGNQKFYRILARFGGQLGISVDFFRLLDSKRRKDRFRQIGLINEPNFEPAGDDETDDYGFRRDKWKGDPVAGAYPEDPRWYGKPTAIVGLRIFPNPDFTDAMKTEWLKDKKASVRKYFASPGKVEPPYVVGITCALCHIAFDPLNPPADPASPRWENLAANIGNQYFREGDLFFGAGRVGGGDANPDPSHPDDPYATKGLDESNFLYQYGHTQQPGTSETSRFSYDFINNPNTINQIAFIGDRAKFAETTSTGVKVITNHILKDGADSVGIHGALLRVFINIGSEGDYWADHLWNPATGTTQKPFSLKEVRIAAGLAPASGEADLRRKEQLLRDYPELGQAWREQERRVPFLASYLASYTPYELMTLKDKLKGKTDKDGEPLLSEDEAVLRRGAEVFAENCASCHSNKQPFYPMATDDDRKRFFKGLVPSDEFLPGNTLSDDVRYPFNYPGLGINPARALATNAVEGDIWADFSSRDYKTLTPLRYMTFENPLHRLDSRFGDKPVVTEFDAPGGGRGYYRTAALNNMWATAPYLHNNSVGVDPVNDQGELDPRYITVEGRLELYKIAMDQLLNPGKRPLKIKVTSADSTFTSGLPGVKRQVAGLLADFARQSTEELIALAVSEAIDGSDIPAQFKPAIQEIFAVLAADLRPDIDKIFTEEGLAKIRDAVIAKARDGIKQIIAEKLKDKPQLASLVTPLLPKFEAAMQKHTVDLASLLRAELSIPKGTPVNLFMNLHIAKVPYALKVYLKLKHDPARLAEALLKLSDCPDLVDNHGHTFGSDLPPEDKKALTEYMKFF